jgi:hypothetical protein
LTLISTTRAAPLPRTRTEAFGLKAAASCDTVVPVLGVVAAAVVVVVVVVE